LDFCSSDFGIRGRERERERERERVKSETVKNGG